MRSIIADETPTLNLHEHQTVQGGLHDCFRRALKNASLAIQRYLYKKVYLDEKK
jgi:hypothetical protein